MTPTEIKNLRESLNLSRSNFGRLLGYGSPYPRVRELEEGLRIPSSPTLQLLTIIQYLRDKYPKVLAKLFYF